MSAADAPEVASGLRVQTGSDGVQTWWLCNEARRNAVSPEALRWIAERSATLRAEIVVLRGAGDRVFCAGFDLSALSEALDRDPRALPDQSLIAATLAMHQADATFIAAIEGHAIGAGVELACACDLRLCRRDVFFAVPAAELGVVYHADGLTHIREVFGPAGVRRLLLLGDRIDAEDAWSAGALVRLCEPDQFETTLADMRTRLQAAAPLSLRGNRTLLRALDRGPLTADERARHDARRRDAYASEDLQEAGRARRERRSPQFKGR
ncbi:MAG: enoyl-CoA hydratase/isomerase family protein [Myxococcota bacterium]